MNKYLTDHCFNPNVESKNALHFFDFCLQNLTTPFESFQETVYPAEDKIIQGLNPEIIGLFWNNHKESLIEIIKLNKEREVVTENYNIKYEDVMDKTFIVLDTIASKVNDEI